MTDLADMLLQRTPESKSFFRPGPYRGPLPFRTAPNSSLHWYKADGRPIAELANRHEAEIENAYGTPHETPLRSGVNGITPSDYAAALRAARNNVVSYIGMDDPYKAKVVPERGWDDLPNVLGYYMPRTGNIAVRSGTPNLHETLAHEYGHAGLETLDRALGLGIQHRSHQVMGGLDDALMLHGVANSPLMRYEYRELFPPSPADKDVASSILNRLGPAYLAQRRPMGPR